MAVELRGQLAVAIDWAEFRAIYAVMGGKGSIFSGWKTKLQGVLANVIPNEVLAEQHRKMAEPGSGQ